MQQQSYCNPQDSEDYLAWEAEEQRIFNPLLEGLVNLNEGVQLTA